MEDASSILSGAETDISTAQSGSGGERRRILIAAPEWYPASRSGFARVATDTARLLAGLGHQVTVVTARDRSLPRRSIDGNLTLLSLLPRRPVPATAGDVVALALFARRHRSRFDVLLGHGPTATLGLELGAGSRPVAYCYHSPHAEELSVLAAGLNSRLGRIRARLLSHISGWIEGIAVRRARRILVLSDFVAGKLAALYEPEPDRVRKVGGGVDVQRFNPGDGRAAARQRLGLDASSTLLFTVRRLEPRMGLENLILSLGLIAELERPQLAIAGTGPLAERLSSVASEHGLAAHVRLLGRVSDDDLADWYRAANLFVLPTVALEGFGMVTAEALASGTLVVGTPVGATPELLEPLDSGLIAKGIDPAALAEAILYGLATSSAELEQRTRDYAVSAFDWRLVIQTWEGALLELCSDTPPTPT